MIATMMTRDEAKEEARGRLPEILTEVIPGFRPERAFRCLSPNHEDRHPSARYLSRVNMVKCFACGWSGDVFDVIETVYGLDKGDAFDKVYDMLGIDAKSSGRRPRKPAAKSKADPGTWDGIIAMIYPPGWDAPEPKVKLPLPLEVVAEAETGLLGRLILDPDSIAICIDAGLRECHFEDMERGELYEDIRVGVPLNASNLEFINWFRERATVPHMLRKLAVFIVSNGTRRALDGILAGAFSRLQNQEPLREVLAGLLVETAAATGELYIIPAGLDDNALGAVADDLFERFHAGEDSTRIMGEMHSTRLKFRDFDVTY